MIETTILFFIIAAIIIIGYLSSVFFEKTKIPDIIILMFLGLLIGPIFNVFGNGITSAFRSTMPFFSALALIIMLFQGGLHINFFRVLKSLGKAAIFTMAVFLLTAAAITLLLNNAFGWGILESALLGVILGGTCSTIVASTINKTSASEETVMLLDLESSITDAFSVILAFAVVGLMKAKEINFSVIGNDILAAFSISAVIAFVAALVWLKIKRRLYQGKYEYLLTIAVLLLLYAFVEYFRANGAIAALTFGVILGNAKEITAMLRLSPKDIDYRVVLFQEEISFFVRTFFFVYLGMVFDLKAVSIEMIVIAAAIMAIIFAARLLGAEFVTVLSRSFSKDRKIIAAMMPRGLAAAVLASMAVGIGLQQDYSRILYISFLVIIMSNMFTAAGILISERKAKAGTKDESMEEIDVAKEIENGKKAEGAKKEGRAKSKG